MNVCGSCDIAFNTRKCPLCEAKEELDSLQAEMREHVCSAD